MTEERKASLLERLLAMQLTEAEKEELTGEMKADPAFAATVNFNIKLSSAMQEERLTALRTERNKEKLRRQIIKYAVGVLVALILSGIFYLSIKPRSAIPFSPEEGVDLMNDVVAAAASKEDVDVVAGGNWRNDLMEGPRSSGKYEGALTLLVIELDQRGYCQDYQLDFYAGVLELYISRAPKQAAPLLECLWEKSIKRYAEELKLPMILLRLAQGEDVEAATLFNQSGLPYTVLPAAARKRIELINQ